MNSIFVNGKSRVLAPGATVSSLLEQLGLQPMQVVIEYNGDPLARGRFGQIVLIAGDKLEIAQMVGGG